MHRNIRNWIGGLGVLAIAATAYGKTVVGMAGPRFTLNGKITYTAESGFPHADPSIEGALLNVRAVQAIFDDANYPRQGSAAHPYISPRVGPVVFDYPDAPFSADRNLREFLAAIPGWRAAGLLAFTVNLQGGGPTDGNFGARMQPHDNSGFDSKGNLKPAYASRLKQVIEKADDLGMVVIVGFFYQGQIHRIEQSSNEQYIKEATRQASQFLRGLPHRNILIEIANEIGRQGAGAEMYSRTALQTDGILDLVRVSQEAVAREIPVSFSWVGDPPASSRGLQALQAVDYIMFHTNHLMPQAVHARIRDYRQAAGYKRPLLVNEDEVSVSNLQAAAQEQVGWGYYDQGLNNYRDGFQSPPVDWKIGSQAKWLFFEQVAKLTGSPVPPKPVLNDPTLAGIRILGLEEGETLSAPRAIEIITEDHEPRWPVTRVEFMVDGVPVSYTRNAPFLVGNRSDWDPRSFGPGRHTLRVLVYDERGPAFTEVCSFVERTFNVQP